MKSDDPVCKYIRLREIERKVNELTFMVYGMGMRCHENELFELIGEGLQLEHELGKK